jgi:hypothetical protein
MKGAGKVAHCLTEVKPQHLRAVCPHRLAEIRTCYLQNTGEICYRLG